MHALTQGKEKPHVSPLHTHTAELQQIRLTLLAILIQAETAIPMPSPNPCHLLPPQTHSEPDEEPDLTHYLISNHAPLIHFSNYSAAAAAP